MEIQNSVLDTARVRCHMGTMKREDEEVVGQPRLELKERKRMETQAREISQSWQVGLWDWKSEPREGSPPEAELRYCNLEVRSPGGARRGEGGRKNRTGRGPEIRRSRRPNELNLNWTEMTPGFSNWEVAVASTGTT